MSVNSDESFTKTAKKKCCQTYIFSQFLKEKTKCFILFVANYAKAYIYGSIYINIFYKNTLNINDINVKKMCMFY